MRPTRKHCEVLPQFRLVPLLAAVLLVAPRAGADTFFSSRVEYPCADEPVAIAVGDLNNDTHPDLVVQPNTSLSLVSYLGVGDGSFPPYQSWVSPGFGYNLSLGKIDSDEWLDLVRPNAGGGIDRWLGNGTGNLGPLTRIDTPIANPVWTTLGDFNEDGKLDIAAANGADGGGIVVHLGNGDGTFDKGTVFATPPGPQGVETADLNGDGHLDLVAAILGTSVELNLVSVLLGDGQGSFGAKTDFTVNLGPWAVAIADLNNDTKPDLAVAGTHGSVAVLLGNGTGSFGAKTEYPVGHLFDAIAVADLDGDGAKEVIVPDTLGGSTPGQIIVLKGVGDGTLGAATYHETWPSPLTVAIADLNHDGKPDVVTANSYPPAGTFDYAVSVFLNCTPCAPTAVSVALERIEVVGDHHVRATWLLPSGSKVWGTVQRKVDGGEWEDLTTNGAVDAPRFTYEDATASPGLRYAYRLSLHDASDSWLTGESWIYVPAFEAAPASLSLRGPYPNPARGAISLRFGQPVEGSVLLGIFDIHGRQVARVVAAARPAGWFTATWDGMSASGVRAPSGVYFAILEGSGETARRRFVLAR